MRTHGPRAGAVRSGAPSIARLGVGTAAPVSPLGWSREPARVRDGPARRRTTAPAEPVGHRSLGGAIAWAPLSAALWAEVLAAAVTGWRIPANALGIPGNGFMPGDCDIQGIAPVAYALFAVALGIAAGATRRRVVPATATTLALFVPVRLTVATPPPTAWLP